MTMTKANSPDVAENQTHVRIGLVGVNFGAYLARNLTLGNPYVKIAAICDANEARAQALAEELNVPFFTSIDQMLTDPSVEAVGLFTPPIGRAKLIRQILEAGRHVMTTKPFEVNVSDAESVLREAADRKLAVHLNSPTPVPQEDMVQIKTWVREHELGRVIGMRAATWASYREKANGSWYDDPARCPAAPILRLGIYFLNDFAALLGTPSRVHVMQSRIFTERSTSDNAQLSIEFETGALANIYASFCVDDGEPWRDEVTLNFERGTIRRWIERTTGDHMAKDYAVTELRRKGAASVRATTQPGAYAGWYDWKTFHACVRGKMPLQPAEEILCGVRLLDAMRRSSVSGQPESVNL